MSKEESKKKPWKLVRQFCSDEKEFLLSLGENKVGRGFGNDITLLKIAVSKQHCILYVDNDKVTLKDLQSANGTFVGNLKCTSDVPTPIYANDIIGFGRPAQAALPIGGELIFKLVRRDSGDKGEDEKDIPKNHKRKLSVPETKRNLNDSIPIIDLVAEDDQKHEPKKIKIEPENNDVYKILDTRSHNNSSVVKQEKFDYNEEPVLIDSESDNETEVCFSQLSRISPKNPLTDHNIKPEPLIENSNNNIDNYVHSNLTERPTRFLQKEKILSTTGKRTIKIELQNSDVDNTPKTRSHNDSFIVKQEYFDYNEEPILIDSESDSENEIWFSQLSQISPENPLTNYNIKPEPDAQILPEPNVQVLPGSLIENSENNIDNYIHPNLTERPTQFLQKEKIWSSTGKRTIEIEPRICSKIIPLKNTPIKCKPKRQKNKGKSGHNEKLKHLSSEQKEIRREKLKEIAAEAKARTVKENCSKDVNNDDAVKQKVAAKVTKKNRGAFLIEAALPRPPKSKNIKNKDSKKNPSLCKESNCHYKNSAEKINEAEKRKDIGLEKEKVAKSVTFSAAPSQIREFYIEPGNNLKNIKLIKSSLLHARRPRSLFSLSQIYLGKILKWSTHWLDDQLKSNVTPPVTTQTPKCLQQIFDSHDQYVELIGDLLLLEIWECLTEAYLCKPNLDMELKLKLISEPVLPLSDRCFHFFHLTTEVTIPKSEVKSLPMASDILIIMFGPKDKKNINFFFVQNVKYHSSQANGNTFIINLLAASDNISTIKQGDILCGRKLIFIKNELALFDAMDYLPFTPLCETLLQPQPKLFPSVFNQYINAMVNKCPWNSKLNSSQLQAVQRSVTIALGDRAAIQMVQGPPGTGKSRVICSIVMSYFYNEFNCKVRDRRKILICASSNAAVDELVIRLLKIRQELPHAERFRMVRVGRLEAMHTRARDISSEVLAERDLRRQEAQTTSDTCEKNLLMAKINMAASSLEGAHDESTKAYHEQRLKRYTQKQTAARERVVIECADIIVTTLTSAAHAKMKGLKGQIALCIVDEAGQAIEPESLIPLTLDVTRITLVGDTQQLPGFICSQRAKSLGFSKSLFARLFSFTEQWEDASSVTTLNTQYRMHPDIFSYPNRTFYRGQIMDAPTIRDDLGIPHYSLISICSSDKKQDNLETNQMEAWGVSRLAVAIQKLTKAEDMTLAIITPYNAQKNLIKRILLKLQGPDAKAINVNTVDSFQGQERDVILVSLARSSGAGFLTDTGRVNVMLTRARHSLLVCLNVKALATNSQWKTLIDDAKKRGFYRTLPEGACQPTGRQDDRILRHLNV